MTTWWSFLTLAGAVWTATVNPPRRGADTGNPVRAATQRCFAYKTARSAGSVGAWAAAHEPARVRACPGRHRGDRRGRSGGAILREGPGGYIEGEVLGGARYFLQCACFREHPQLLCELQTSPPAPLCRPIFETRKQASARRTPSGKAWRSTPSFFYLINKYYL